MPLGKDLPGGKSTCGKRTKMCPDVSELSASANRRVERPLRFSIINHSSMRLNHIENGLMKSSSTRTGSPKNRTRWEWPNAMSSSRMTSLHVMEKSSMIRRSWCYCMRLLNKRNWGRHVNPLEPEQLITSSVSTSSAVLSTAALLLEYPYTLPPYRLKQVSATRMNRRPAASYR